MQNVFQESRRSCHVFQDVFQENTTSSHDHGRLQRLPDIQSGSPLQPNPSEKPKNFRYTAERLCTACRPKAGAYVTPD
eukprot:1124350-Karenia_brevis.AAC.1